MKRIGDYLIEHQLDARTYLAVHAVLPRRARITVGGIQEMREACLLEALAHPGVPRVYECGLLPDRRPWLAVECVDGELPGRLSEAGVVEMIRCVAEILDHAHRRGVVHGDVRPEAIVRASPRRGTPYVLLDWGHACCAESQRSDVVALGAIANAHLPPGARPRLARLVAQMLGGMLSAREVIAFELDEDPVEIEDIVLDDDEPPMPRMRWTPPYGNPVPSTGTPIATLRRR